MAKVFEARYEGRCQDCQDRIEIGDSVTYNGNDEIVHEGCA